VEIAALAARVRTARPRCGATRLVCIDGPSGSGKTTLAARLAAALCDPPGLHMDDIYPGWDGLADAVPLLYDQVVAPLAAGRSAGYRRYDWHRGAFAEAHDLGSPEVLIIEGAGCGARVIVDRATLLLWIEAPLEERFRRGIARDGDAYRPHWERWAHQEAAHFAAEGTAGRADVRVDGAPTSPHDPSQELILLPG
jgi:uridine kinase